MWFPDSSQMTYGGWPGPILRPADQVRAAGPLLILTDATWADGDHWADLARRLRDEVALADAAGRPMALVNLSDAGKVTAPEFGPASPVQDRLRTLLPAAWPPDAARMRALAAALPQGQFDTLWQSDGLDQGADPDPDRAGLLAALQSHGAVRVLVAPADLLALTAPVLGADGITTRLLRPSGGGAETPVLVALGPDPTGAERELARQTVPLAKGATEAAVTLTLPRQCRGGAAGR